MGVLSRNLLARAKDVAVENMPIYEDPEVCRSLQALRSEFKDELALRFYFPRTPGSIGHLLRSMIVKSSCMKRISELEAVLAALSPHAQQGSRLTCQELLKILEDLRLTTACPFNFPAMMLQQQGVHHSICCQKFSYAVKLRLRRCQMRRQLLELDTDGDGYLTITEIRTWLNTLAEEYGWNVPAQLKNQWEIIAPRKIFFLLGRNGLVSIDRLVQSDIMHIIQDQSNGDVTGPGALDWFGYQKNVQKSEAVWSKFSALDVDGDGLLTAAELGPVRVSLMDPTKSTMTDYFLQRVMEVHVKGVSPITSQPAMSLEEFADFLLAWNHRGDPASTRYFFRAIHVEHRNRLSAQVVTMWFEHLRELYQQFYPGEFDDFDPRDVKDEIFDMIKPKNRTFISLTDVLQFYQKPGVRGSELLCMFCDTECMNTYEREGAQ